MGLLKIKIILDRLLATLVIMNMTTLVLVVLWQVISRFFSIPSTTTDELACVQMIGIALLGGAYTVGQKQHLAIDIISARFTGTGRTCAELLYHLIIFLFSFTTLIIGGLRLYWLSLATGQVSSSLGVQVGYLYLVLPLAGAFICAYCVLSVTGIFTNERVLFKS